MPQWRSTAHSIFQISISRNTICAEMIDFSRYGHICMYVANMYQKRRKIFEARVLRHMGRGSGGHSPPDTEKTFKIEHVRSLEILLM